jgi:hypothetical protein
MRLTRRGLQLALGVIWLLDAALQFQPAMFTRSFPDQVLAPAAQGNPAWVARPMTWSATLIAHHVVLANTAFAVIQLVIALAILWRPTVRLGLVLSVPWALAVWWLGEGLGGVLTSGPSAVTGAPGAVILYALLAVLLWPAPGDPYDRYDPDDGGGSVAAGSPLGPVVAGVAWVVLWGSLVYDTLLAASRAAVPGTVSGQGAGEPGWLAAIDTSAGRQLAAHGAAVSAVLAVILAVIAVAVFIPAVARPVLVLAIAVCLAVWLVGEDLGGIFTGTGTDPNTGPLLILLALAYWPRRAGDQLRPVREQSAVLTVPSRH